MVLSFDLFYIMETSHIHGFLCERLAVLISPVFLFFNKIFYAANKCLF